MTVVCNYQYTDEMILSTDTMDIVSAWIGNSLRGLARIAKVNEEDFAAYLTVYGNALDNLSEVEFRIWDASVDLEYNGYANPTVTFDQNAFIGLSSSPIVLDIDRDSDRARYIHLNQGFTWISFNSVEEDMGINNVFRELDQLTSGDRIIGQNGFAEYIDGLGWIADPTVMLDTISTEESYMVYLQNGPDSIRITGGDALPYSRVIIEGTNWIGFPAQIEQSVEDAIGVNSLSNVSILRNQNQSRLSVGNEWTDGNLLEMSPNDGYQLTVSANTVINVPGTNPSGKEDGQKDFLSRNFTYPADPWDQETWTLEVNEYAYSENIPFIGSIRNGIQKVTSQGEHKIAAFVGNDLRAVADINLIAPLAKDMYTLLIGINDFARDTVITLYYFDGVKVVDSLSMETSSMLSNGNGIYNYLNPYDFNFCKQEILLELDKHRLEGQYFATDKIIVDDNLQLLENKIVEFNAPEVRFRGEVNNGQNSFMIIKKDGCVQE